MVGCQYFSGYKPCDLNERCDVSCPSLRVGRPRILIVHLEALGAVLRATCLLPAIRARHPHAHITWVTQAPAQHLLSANPMVDRILTTHPDDLLALTTLRFDLTLVVDKSLKAAGVAGLARSTETRGFVVDPSTGAIVPANPEAEELWELGLSNHKKFFVNQKPETQLLTEAMGFSWNRDEYVLQLTVEEKKSSEERRQRWLRRGDVVVGINTGSSGIIPYKRWPVRFQRDLVTAFSARGWNVVLLGGREDETRNLEIGSGTEAILSPTNLGLRDGLSSVAACDVVVSGDSLGMHMAIALGKWVVAWFGPTCAHEIDLYDRGLRLQANVPCAPCWKRSCSQPTMCYDRVPLESVVSAVQQGLEWKISSSKPPISATSFLASP